jgi:DNA-binding NarL/FixJ family response regulator
VPGEPLGPADPELRGFVRHVASGLEFPFIGEDELLAQLRAPIAGSPDAPHDGRELTKQESRVAALAGAGATNREVARALGLSVKTVEAHLARAYRKLQITSRAELAARLEADRPLGRPARPNEPSGGLKSTSVAANDPAGGNPDVLDK